MNKKFDFSEIDGALPTAEKMQEQDRIIDALKNNYEAVRILSANVEKLENRLSEALPKMDGAVSSPCVGQDGQTLGEEARERRLNRRERKSAGRWRKATEGKGTGRAGGRSAENDCCLSPQPLSGVW